jgi:hypothetical protein
MCPLWQKLWIIIVKIIKRMKVSGENMTTMRLKSQEAWLSKVRGNSGITTHSGTEFTAQRNVIQLNEMSSLNIVPVSLYNYLYTQLMHIKLRSQLSVLNNKLFSFWSDPVRIRVRIDPPHPLVCRKRRLNGAVLRMGPEKPRSRVTAGVAR